MSKEISSLEMDVASWQEQLKTASPSQKPFIASQINKLNAQIEQKKPKLNRCKKANFSALIIYNNDFYGLVQNTRTALENRGYAVSLTDDCKEGLKLLQDASENLMAGARMFVYLAGHGSNPRGFGDTAVALALDHYIGFGPGKGFTVREVAPLFEALAKKGVHLTVIDGSCDGGETVLNAIGQTYCAMATTGVYSPSLTDIPDPSNAIQKDRKPSTFGLWWDDPHLSGSWMNGAIVSAIPERLSQRLYRNDKGEFSRLSLFIRPSIDSLKVWDCDGWTLHHGFNGDGYCYLFQYIYPEKFDRLSQNEKNKFTNDTESFIALVHAVVDPQTKFLDSLKDFLNMQDLIANAAKVYAEGYSRAWQTLANDPMWNPSADPRKYFQTMYGLSPADYPGETGFFSMVKELKNMILLMQIGFAQQEDLLRKMDETIKEISRISPKVVSLPKIQRRSFIPPPVAFYMRYNESEREFIRKIKAIDMQMKINHGDMMKLLRTHIFKSMTASEFQDAEKVQAINVITRSMAPYKEHFKALGILSNEIVIPRDDVNKVILEGMKEKLADLIADFKGISVDIVWKQSCASFLLALIEDAVALVQSNGENPGDLIYY